jgi:hypothetical protein
MRKLIIAFLVAIAAPTTAHADIGLGIFIGEPFGVDLKLGIGPRSGLDIVLGASSYRRGRTDYGHVTYLVTPFVGRGDSVLVPLRLGIGGAVYALVDGDPLFSIRAPFEVGLRFRRTPLEVYGEIALQILFFDDPDLDVQGGIGLRFFF